eukprot:m.37312 g.37312  ORF g.37312 m.37312 type:complete len:692 (+) comp13062_c0_seq1:691-2766(+)
MGHRRALVPDVRRLVDQVGLLDRRRHWPHHRERDHRQGGLLDPEVLRGVRILGVPASRRVKRDDQQRREGGVLPRVRLAQHGRDGRAPLQYGSKRRVGVNVVVDPAGVLVGGLDFLQRQGSVGEHGGSRPEEGHNLGQHWPRRVDEELAVQRDAVVLSERHCDPGLQVDLLAVAARRRHPAKRRLPGPLGPVAVLGPGVGHRGSHGVPAVPDHGRGNGRSEGQHAREHPHVGVPEDVAVVAGPALGVPWPTVRVHPVRCPPPPGAQPARRCREGRSCSERRKEGVLGRVQELRQSEVAANIDAGIGVGRSHRGDVLGKQRVWSRGDRGCQRGIGRHRHRSRRAGAGRIRQKRAREGVRRDLTPDDRHRDGRRRWGDRGHRSVDQPSRSLRPKGGPGVKGAAPHGARRGRPVEVGSVGKVGSHPWPQLEAPQRSGATRRGAAGRVDRDVGHQQSGASGVGVCALLHCDFAGAATGVRGDGSAEKGGRGHVEGFVVCPRQVVVVPWRGCCGVEARVGADRTAVPGIAPRVRVRVGAEAVEAAALCRALGGGDTGGSAVDPVAGGAGTALCGIRRVGWPLESYDVQRGEPGKSSPKGLCCAHNVVSPGEVRRVTSGKRCQVTVANRRVEPAVEGRGGGATGTVQHAAVVDRPEPLIRRAGRGYGSAQHRHCPHEHPALVRSAGTRRRWHSMSPN